MKKLYIFFSVIVFIFIIFFSCQQTGGGGGGSGGDDTTVKWASQKKIIASFASSADEDHFGDSVSISGDYAIVGAPNEGGVVGINRGGAYIFHRTGTNTWDAGVRIGLMTTSDGDKFGCSVSISGEYAIIGAYCEDSNGTDSGAAYILHRTDTNLWLSVIRLIAFDASEYDHFGDSVSISGDYAIVGAEGENGSGADKGAAYIFHRTGENIWDAVTKITASDAADYDYFGSSVSISGDYAIVGADSNDENGADSGAVYIFHRTGENIWDAVTKITASDAADIDYYGVSVSISGDYAIVGAGFEDGSGTNRGAAYILHRYDVNSWEQVTKITASDAADNDHFGDSVSISGDCAIVGAKDEDGSGADGADRGSAYIFRNRTGTNIWDMTSKITASDTADFDKFGLSVSISGDYAIIGAPYENGIGSSRGTAYIIK